MCGGFCNTAAAVRADVPKQSLPGAPTPAFGGCATRVYVTMKCCFEFLWRNTTAVLDYLGRAEDAGGSIQPRARTHRQ